jgi:methionine biosynthesis protein MetW
MKRLEALPTTNARGLRPDLALIADRIAPGARVLDLGCGDGALLAHVQQYKACSGYGVEIDDEQVLACAQRGVDVIQRDIEAGLGMFAASRFDVVVLSMAIQATQHTERVLHEMSTVGAQCIVSFPEFWSLVSRLVYFARSHARSRTPCLISGIDTPNVHLATLADFEDLLTRGGLSVTRREHLAQWPRPGASPVCGLRRPFMRLGLAKQPKKLFAKLANAPKQQVNKGNLDHGF